MIKDNPNPAANIGFHCVYPFQYFVYKNIYRHLPNAEFIVDDSYRVMGYESNAESKQRLFSFFARLNVHWRKLERNSTDYTRTEFFDKYGLLVYTIFHKEIQEPPVANKKLVRLLYGNAKDPWNFGPWNAYYDKILAYGPYSHRYLSIYGNSEIVGNPKFDDWHDIEKNKRTQTSKKNILYLPTWGELSSLPNVYTALNALSQEYAVTVKAHHLTMLFHQEMLDAFRDNPRIVIADDTEDILPLLYNADIVLSDNSGSIFDAVWTNKPLILINTHDPNLMLAGKKSMIYKSDGKHMGFQTSATSLEQQIRHPETAIGPVISDIIDGANQIDPASVRSAILESDIKKDIFEIRRKALKQNVFSHTDGPVGKRAAQIILDVLYNPKSQKNWIAESIDVYIREFFPPKRYSSDDVSLIELGKKHKELLGLPFISRVSKVFEHFFTS